MTKKNRGSGPIPDWKPAWWLIAVWGLTLVGIVLTYDKLPQQIPMHWNLQGEVDRYGAKFSSILGMLALSVGIYIGMALTARIDPSKRNYSQFGRAFDWIRIPLTLFPLILLWIVISSALGMTIDIGGWVGTMVSALILIVGNRLGQVKHNYFIGIKTPWTLASETVWRRTHRFSAWLWSGAGLIGLIGSLFIGPPVSFYLLMGALLVAGVVSVAYSYVAYKQETRG